MHLAAENDGERAAGERSLASLGLIQGDPHLGRIQSGPKHKFRQLSGLGSATFCKIAFRHAGMQMACWQSSTIAL